MEDSQIRRDIQDFFEEEQRIQDEQKRQNVAEASKEAQKAFNSADISRLLQSDNDEFMNYFYSTTPPNIHEVEVNPAGGPGKGSGSKCKRKKDKKGTKIHVEPWMLL